MPVILLTNRYSDQVIEVVRKEVPAGFDFISLEKACKEELVKKASMADYFLASGRLSIDEDVISAASKLKMVQRTGVGTDTLDLKALERKNIPVYVNQGVNSTSVAEHTIMLILAVLRKLPYAHDSVRAGQWLKNDIGIECHSLTGKSVGLLGMGNIGKKVVNMLSPFDVKIFYHDPVRLSEREESHLKVSFLPFHDLLKEADILSLHCPLTSETEGLIGEEEVDMIKPGAFIVNTSRGPVFDESALVTALKSGHIGGAGLDVFSAEPLNYDNPLLKLNNVVLTPHVGGLTLETFSMMMRNAFENIGLFNRGKKELIEDKKNKECYTK